MKKESIKENEEMFISGLQWINRDNQRTIVLHSQGKEVWRTGEKTGSAAKSKAGLIPLLFFLFFIFITDYTCYNTLPDKVNKGKGEKKKLFFIVKMYCSPTLSARMASVLSRPLADLSLAARESLSA